MKELKTILGSATSTTPAVLATLVKVNGSSYRRVGARLWWNPQGVILGSISGGCLEEDLLARARDVFQSRQTATIVYDTTSENDLVWGVGLGCHGVVHVVLEYVERLPEPLQAVADAWKKREPAVLLTRFGSDGASRTGTLAAVNVAGEIFAPPSKFQVKQTLVRECFNERRARLDRDPAIPEEEILYEFLPPPVALTVWGAGNDAQPLVLLAAELGWDVTVSDPRSAFATSARFPRAQTVQPAPLPILGSVKGDPWHVAVVMSHHYRFDVPALRILLPLELPYLGLLGPKKRAEKILADLTTDGLSLTAQMRESLRAPVGLDLGANAPEQVALAIVAEIEAVLNHRDARPLRERAHAIHD